jgi:hypothetical protein
MRLDTYVEEGGPIPDLILLDVEHAEGRVLKGMFGTMERYSPVIIVEMHGTEAIQESWNELKKHNYFLLRLPDFEVVNSVSNVTCGHYVAAPSSYFDQNLG